MLLCLTVFSCKPKKDIIYSAPAINFEERLLDTLTVSAPRFKPEEKYTRPVYNPSARRSYDLIHTDLKLTFDWINQFVNGVATIELTPLFYPLDHVVLDAQNFDFHSVSFENNSRELEYDYDGNQIFISLGNYFNRGDKIVLSIQYTAKPNEGEEGGSTAITSDKGLFYINPTGTNPHKPQQIWTQGETQNNSRWFPTFDKPNERMTQSISMTVADKFQTLSNGILQSSTRNADGTRTDIWVQNKPHAPYLTMIAIGEFATVEETWNGIPLMYMVNKNYQSSAKEIFNHTPDMLTYFSNALDYNYPWDKYAQIIVTDYVSGAMENTSAVVFGDFVQKSTRELIDNGNDAIVAHEMFHHWFGDLVTCESWANLTLNEGFANYAEYLWFEHKYGTMRADEHRVSEINGYLQSYQSGNSHPMIHYGYDDKESMFDAHSYNKGGLILHMLRKYVGDDAFFTALNKYLTDNAFSAVEADELRMAFEDVTGEDLNWFFDQWYFEEGHPELIIDYEYIPSQKTIQIAIEQVQDPEKNVPVYILPTQVAIYDQAGNKTLIDEWIDARRDTIWISDIPDRPSVIVLDGENDLLSVKQETRSLSENLALYSYSDNFIDKLNALKFLRTSDTLQSLMPQLLNDAYYAFRAFGVSNIDLEENSSFIPALESMASNDNHSTVRSQAIRKLSTLSDYNIIPLAEKAMSEDQAYPVVNTALKSIAESDARLGIRYAEMFMEEETNMLLTTIAEIFYKSGNPGYLPWFENNLHKASVFQLYSFWGAYGKLLKAGGDKEVQYALPTLLENALNQENITFKRFMATNIIQNLRSSPNLSPETVQKLSAAIETIVSREKNLDLLERYSNFK